ESELNAAAFALLSHQARGAPGVCHWFLAVDGAHAGARTVDHHGSVQVWPGTDADHLWPRCDQHLAIVGEDTVLGDTHSLGKGRSILAHNIRAGNHRAAVGERLVARPMLEGHEEP